MNLVFNRAAASSGLCWLCCLLPSYGSAVDWKSVILHPAEATASRCLGVRDGEQVGWAFVNGVPSAYLWRGSASSGLNINPPGAVVSLATGVSNGVQVGEAVVNQVRRAVLWKGTGLSWEDLHPDGQIGSGITAIDGTLLGGYTQSSLFINASLWDLSRPDWLNLGGNANVAGVHGGSQVGSSLGFACMWRGSPTPRINLHPINGYRSYAFGVYDNEQVGIVEFDENPTIAVLWRGTPQYLQLDENAHAQAIWGGQPVGHVYVAGDTHGIAHATRWTSGGSQSRVDLHPSLPPGYSKSYATGVWDDSEESSFVSGYAVRENGGVEHAVMWQANNISTARADSLQIVRGIVTKGGLASIEHADDEYLVLRPGIRFSSIEDPIEVVVDGQLSNRLPKTLSISVEMSTSGGQLLQKTGLFRFGSNTYTALSAETVGPTDVRNRSDVTFDRFLHIQPNTGRVRARISISQVSPLFGYPWQARIDRIWFHYLEE